MTLFGANVLVSYAIGRMGDGGDRKDAALEVELPPEGVERTMAENGKLAWEQVKKCEKPMLFIHGTSDDFILYEMMGILYEAKPGTNKKQISVPGAGHGQAASAMGDEYWEEVFDFLENCR